MLDKTIFNKESCHSENILICPTCGNKITDINALRCPRCFSSMLKMGCDGACSKCKMKSTKCK